MNRPPAVYLQPPLSAPHRPAAAEKMARGISLPGAVLFVSAVLVVASGYLSLRPEVFGLALHPMLVPLGLAFPFLALSRISVFPPRVLVTLVAFNGLYLASIVNGTSFSLFEFFKMSAAFVTIFSCALLVRKRGDFVAGAVGLAISAALLAAKGLSADDVSGIMDGANKNSYSMYALPAILMSGFIYLRMKNTPYVIRAALVACTIPALVAIFLGGNRSGYLGAVIVALMLFWDQRGKGMVLVGIVTCAVVLLITQFGDTTVFNRRMQQTVEDNKSDELRIKLFEASFNIALANPIIGVSPQAVTAEVAEGVGSPGARIETHNMPAHVMSGSGFLCLAMLLAFVWAMWSPFSPSDFPKLAPDDPVYEARKMMRMMVVLWFIRGQFTREILYMPGFNVGLGLSIGLLILALTARQKQAAGRIPPAAVQALSPAP